MNENDLDLSKYTNPFANHPTIKFWGVSAGFPTMRFRATITNIYCDKSLSVVERDALLSKFLAEEYEEEEASQ